MSLALGLRGLQSPMLRCQALLEGPLGGKPRVRVSPKKAGRPDPPLVHRAEGWAKVSALASGSVGPSVLVRGAFEFRRGLGGP